MLINVISSIEAKLKASSQNASQQHNYITRCIYIFLSVIRYRIL